LKIIENKKGAVRKRRGEYCQKFVTFEKFDCYIAGNVLKSKESK